MPNLQASIKIITVILNFNHNFNHVIFLSTRLSMLRGMKRILYNFRKVALYHCRKHFNFPSKIADPTTQEAGCKLCFQGPRTHDFQQPKDNLIGTDHYLLYDYERC
jgi:hypothetical protein